MREIARILKPRSRFLFTTHDRDNIKNRQYWENEKKQWLSNSQMLVLDDFGDIYYRGDHGNIFIHSPVRSEIEDDLQAAGFVLLECSLRSIIAQEPHGCRFLGRLPILGRRKILKCGLKNPLFALNNYG
ncbi:MAG: hypothetical protein ACLUKN_13260 [Bacilli bacterium]